MENYFVISEDSYLLAEKLKEVGSQHDLNPGEALQPADWHDFAQVICSQALFAETQMILVDFAEMAKWQLPDDKSIARTLEAHGNVLVVTLLGRPDKRLKLYKLMTSACQVVELKPPRGNDLNRWVVERAKELGGNIDGAAAAHLVFLAGSDLQTLNSELGKLVNYSEKIDRQTVDELTVRTLQAGIFDLVDAAAEGKTQRALQLVEELYTGNADTPYLLQMLARQYRLLFQVLFHKSRGLGSSQVEKEMGLHPYVFGKLWKQAALVDQQHCARALQQLAEADYQFKTGHPSGLALLQAVLVKMAKK